MLSLGVVFASLFAAILIETVFRSGGTSGNGGLVASWWHPPGGPGAGSQNEFVQWNMRRTGFGPLFDSTEWTFYFSDGITALVQPDPAMLARAMASIRDDLDSMSTRSLESLDDLDPRPVALDFFARGQTQGVIVDGRARAWNIVRRALVVVAIVHLLTALAMTIHDRQFRVGKAVPALSRWHATMLLSLCILLPATVLLGLFWFNLPDPWWAYAFAPLVLLAIVLSVGLPNIAARLRRASSADGMLCTVCLYDLRDLPAVGRCPECGTPYELAATILAWHRVRNSGLM